MVTIHIGQTLTGSVVGKDADGNVQAIHGLTVASTEPSIVSVSIDATDPNNPVVKATGVTPGTTHVIIHAMNSQNASLSYTEDFTSEAAPTATSLTVTWQ